MEKTVARLHSFVFAMVLHPLVYKKAQAEMDLVVGNQRLPNSPEVPINIDAVPRKEEIVYRRCLDFVPFGWATHTHQAVERHPGVPVPAKEAPTGYFGIVEQ